MGPPKRLRLVAFQDLPGFWTVRGLEHDLACEARALSEAVRAICRLVQAHSAFDVRHKRVPLSAFRAAPQTYWNAFSRGTPVSLAALNLLQPTGWGISIAIAPHRPLGGGSTLWSSRSRLQAAAPACTIVPRPLPLQPS